MARKRTGVVVAALLSVVCQPLLASPPALETLFADAAYSHFTISPNGKYFAVITPLEGRDTLVTLKADKSELIGHFNFRDGNESVLNYRWMKDEHLLIKPARIYGWKDAPSWYGDLFAAKANGEDFRAIYGYRAGEKQVGSLIKKAQATLGWGDLVSDLPDDAEHILVASYPYVVSGGSQPTVQRINLRTALSRRALAAPASDAHFWSSPRGDVRFATAVDKDDIEHVYEYLQDSSTWKEIASNSIRGGAMEPVGLTADGRTLYYLSDADARTNGLFALDLVDRTQRLVYRHETDNIDNVVLDPWTGELMWLTHSSDYSVHTLNPEHKLSKIRSLVAKSFPGSYVSFTSVTRDNKKAIFYVQSDRDPGAWYSLDTDTRKAALELEANTKIDPEQMLPMQPISLTARDGLALNGFYTAKARTGEQKPPMVVLVHGGPHHRDSWEFNPEVQMLATRGYAVLQVNFRGSTGYGRDFERAGRGQWGRAMQDDLTDATRWAIEQGLADPQRICIMGGSYGGYASLMGVIREPDLYRCAIDFYGVTDMEEFFKGGDIPDMLSGKAYLKDAIGTDRKEWDARSPTKLADQVKAPVLIIAGGKDDRVPIIHSEKMEKALKKAGKSVETLYFDSEGHGFYKLEHRVAAYQKVLDFLGKHIGKPEL